MLLSEIIQFFCLIVVFLLIILKIENVLHLCNTGNLKKIMERYTELFEPKIGRSLRHFSIISVNNLRY